MENRSFTRNEFRSLRRYERLITSKTAKEQIRNAGLRYAHVLRAVFEQYDTDRVFALEGLMLEFDKIAVPTERQARIECLKGKLTGEVFYYLWSRDCDLCESECIERFDNDYEAQLCIDRFYDNAEGPAVVQRATKQDYETFGVPSVYDRAAEMAGY
ncbi:hypothetical protein [Vibrio parahaemolyticus]|uniref:hypothetical protein n=1 Tax=Vibrio parahaemolyticus TaxID=670 RepID=UPI000813C4D5|nr:hypothetical protein [Vibrio parahaemolyticus]OCP68236.1 hypothetical protein AKH08_15580 [Vibrio parahaemolyticus]